jgi:hypothetical protein
MCTLIVDTPKLQLKIIKMDRFLLEKLNGFSQEIPYRLWNPGFIAIVIVCRTTDESREWDTIAANMEFVVKWQWGRQLSKQFNFPASIFISQILCIHAYLSAILPYSLRY